MNGGCTGIVEIRKKVVLFRHFVAGVLSIWFPSEDLPGRRNNPPQGYLSKERVSKLVEFPQGGVSASFSMVQRLEGSDI